MLAFSRPNGYAKLDPALTASGRNEMIDYQIIESIGLKIKQMSRSPGMNRRYLGCRLEAFGNVLVDSDNMPGIAPFGSVFLQGNRILN